MATTTAFWTVARIAAHFGVERHRVTYIIASRDLSPIGTAGRARVFGANAVEQIGNELNDIASERGEVAVA